MFNYTFCFPNIFKDRTSLNFCQKIKLDRNDLNQCEWRESLIEIQNRIGLAQLPIGKLPLSESHITTHISIQLLMVQIDPKEMRL